MVVCFSGQRCAASYNLGTHLLRTCYALVMQLLRSCYAVATMGYSISVYMAVL